MTRRADDRGAALILVLVLVVIAAFMVVPIMSYSVTTMRSNAVLSTRTAQSEAVKAGVRAALARPLDVFDACATAAPVHLTLPTGPGVTTTCQQVGADVHESVASGADRDDHETWYGNQPPAGYTGPYSTEWSSVTEWQDPAEQVWLPDLPAGGVVPRSVPAESGCRVFYPGAYGDPITITGPAYFASGVYWFGAHLSIGPGADVVAGAGPASGCSDDAAAAAANPSNHGITGLGATFVLAGDARIAIADGAGPLRFVLQPRFADDGAEPSELGAGVSIMTVNGAWTATGNATFTVPQRLDVPASDPNGAADPSTVTPHPPEPYPPTNVTASGRNHAGSPVTVVRWQPPATILPGYEPTGYTVLRGGSEVCDVAATARGCVVAGGGVHSFSVRAENIHGESAAVAASPASITAGGPEITPPGPPTAVGLEGSSLLGLVWVTPYEDVFVVEWAPPTSDGGAPITGYTAQATLTVDVGAVAAALPTGWVTSLPLLGGLIGPLLATATNSLTAALVAHVDGLDGAVDGNLNFPDGRCTAPGDATSCVIPTEQLDLLAGALTVPGVCLLMLGSTCALSSGPIDLSPLLPDLLDNLLSAGLVVTVTATNSVGTSTPAVVLAGVNVAGCEYLASPTDACGPVVVPTAPYVPTPLVDIVAGPGSTVAIPGYISVPQGVVRATVTGNAGVDVDGGILAAYTEIAGACTGTCDVGYDDDVVQRTLRITTTIADSNLVSDAIVQVNANGAWAINTWVVQPTDPVP